MEDRDIHDWWEEWILVGVGSGVIIQIDREIDKVN